MSGALIGGLGAILAFGGLWAYLVYLNHRLTAALGELAASGRETAPPEVTVMAMETSDGHV